MLKEPLCDLLIEQAVSIGRERGVVPHLIVNVQAHKPSKQQVVVQLLHQQAGAAHAVQNLQERRSQQPLRRDRRTTVLCIALGKDRVQVLEDQIDQKPHLANRMSRWNPGIH